MVKVNQLDDAFALFSQIHSIDMTERRLRRIVREVLEDFQSDNVTYLELRTTPKHTKEYTQEGYIRIVLDEM
jgi:adenosine deaminase